MKTERPRENCLKLRCEINETENVKKIQEIGDEIFKRDS